MPSHRRAPTMNDVARLAGVNRVTASVALRGARAATQVSETTRQRILDAAKELGYAPSAVSRALRRQQTDIIGYFVGYEGPNAHDPFTADIVNGLQSGCQKHNKDLLIFGGFERHSVQEIYTALASGKIDGLVVVPSHDNPMVEKLAGSHLPVVAIANSDPLVPSVVVDDREGSRLLAEYLARKGHRRLLYRADGFALVSANRRLEAFCQAAEKWDLQVHVYHTSDWQGALDPEEEALLAAPPAVRPTAVVCWKDTLAYALVHQCKQRGIRVPEDLAVVGFDGIITRSYLAYDLTTIRAPWEEAGRIAAEQLVALMQGEEVSPETVLPVELVIGATA